MPSAIAERIIKLRARRKALVGFSDFATDARAQALDRALKTRWLRLASVLGAEMSVLAALAGTDKYGQHFYTLVYEKLARARRRQPVTLLEIGIGGYSKRTGGESLLMWEAYFRKGRVYGIDLRDKTDLSRGRIKVFQCSQVDREKLTALAREIGPFDFIIDDGSHVNAHQIETFRILWPYVKNGGTYVVEDVQTSYWPRFGGGALGSLAYQRSCMSFFKGLADSVNAPEFLAPPAPDAVIERQIESVSFHHNLIVVAKDLFNRVSNFPLEEADTRALLMEPAEGAER
ncbi:MAG TPA: class I SAM-dependent methyltransferase [Burkholderiales bacterium]|nr:class I SAM-dependent methyltransferase [Burkholderiales bacterium]